MKQTLIAPKLTFPSLLFNVMSVLIITFIIATTAHAHRATRSASNEIDACRIRVGYEWIHFSAYTSTFTGNKSYCEAIPNIGKTHLVFDYEGKKLRHVTIEFEVTKEPEGNRIFYLEPTMAKTGTVTGVVDFSKYGAGNYQAHVTIVHKGKKLDHHIPFSVGLVQESQTGFSTTFLIVIAIIIVIYFAIRRFKNKDLKTTNVQHNPD